MPLSSGILISSYSCHPKHVGASIPLPFTHTIYLAILSSTPLKQVKTATEMLFIISSCLSFSSVILKVSSLNQILVHHLGTNEKWKYPGLFPSWIGNSRSGAQAFPMHSEVWEACLSPSFEMNCSPICKTCFSCHLCVLVIICKYLISSLSLGKCLRRIFSNPLLYLPKWPIVVSPKSRKVIPFKTCLLAINMCQLPVTSPWRDKKSNASWDTGLKAFTI